MRNRLCLLLLPSVALGTALANGCTGSSPGGDIGGGTDAAASGAPSQTSSSGGGSSGVSSSGISSSGGGSSGISSSGVGLPGAGSSGASSSGASSSGASSSGASSGGGSPFGDAGSGPADAGWGTPVDGGPAFTGPTVPGTVTVNRTMTVGQIGPGFAGFSFEKTHITNSSFTGKNAPLIALFNLLGPTVIRLGANDVDKCTWVPATPAGGGGPPYSRSVGTAMVDDLANFLSATGSKIIYGVNFNSGTPANDAEEATYVATKLGTSLYGFEIGNEINRFGTWATLKPKWDSIASAILAANPSVHLVGPAGGGGNQTALSTPFAADEAGKNLILLTQHYYAGTATTPTATLAKLLVPDPFPPTSGQGLIDMLQVMNTAATTNKIPDGFRDGECNTFSHHGEPGLSDALISALWSLDFLFTNARYGASGVNFHGGEAGMDGSTPFVYSAIGELNGAVTGAHPLFYGMLLFSLAGNGKMLATTATTASPSFTAYAIDRGDGTLSVVLDNKDTTSAVTATVDVGAAVTKASALYLAGPTPVSLNATTGVTLGGVGISTAGAWAPNPPYAMPAAGHTVTVLVPPASAALVRVQ